MIHTTVSAQFSDNYASGTRSLGMGGNGVSLTGIDAMRTNQAGMTYLSGIAVGLHTESRYLLTDIRTVALDIASPTKYGVFGLSINSFGNKSYKQQKIGIAYARQLLRNLSIGAQFDVLNTSITNYGNKINLSFELGIYSEIFPKLHAGAHIYSPGKIKLTDTDPIPSRIRFGLKYLVSKKFILLSEFDKNLYDEHDIKFGFEYHIIRPLTMRLGITTREGSYSFGMSYYYKTFTIDIGMAQHSILGTSPSLSIKYNIKGAPQLSNSEL